MLSEGEKGLQRRHERTRWTQLASGRGSIANQFHREGARYIGRRYWQVRLLPALDNTTWHCDASAKQGQISAPEEAPGQGRCAPARAREHAGSVLCATTLAARGSGDGAADPGNDGRLEHGCDGEVTGHTTLARRERDGLIVAGGLAGASQPMIFTPAQPCNPVLSTHGACVIASAHCQRR